MKMMGWDVDDIAEKYDEDMDIVAFDCMDCGWFGNDALFNHDDIPQCPKCKSADVAFDAMEILRVMEELPDEDQLEGWTIRDSVDFRNMNGLK